MGEGMEDSIHIITFLLMGKEETLLVYVCLCI